MAKYININKLITSIKRLKQENQIREDEDYATYELDVACGYDMACEDILSDINSLQQEEPEVDLKKEVEFECIGIKVKMTIQELINYYIDTECCNVADECGF